MFVQEDYFVLPTTLVQRPLSMGESGVYNSYPCPLSGNLWGGRPLKLFVRPQNSNSKCLHVPTSFEFLGPRAIGLPAVFRHFSLVPRDLTPVLPRILRFCPFAFPSTAYAALYRRTFVFTQFVRKYVFMHFLIFLFMLISNHRVCYFRILYTYRMPTK